MKKLVLLLLALVVLWDPVWTFLGVPPLFPWQLAAEYRPRHPDLVLLDVRTPREFSWFHIPGARNVPFSPDLAQRLDIPRDQTLVVICMTGHRSVLVARNLQKRGYGKVYNLTGGMAGWQLYRWLIGAGLVERGTDQPPGELTERWPARSGRLAG